MKYALVDGHRCEAKRGLLAECPICGVRLVAKCGERRAWHWAHRGKRYCDRWWEPETEWHRAWKDSFPAAWQEIVHRAEDGEKHIADVKTAYGRIIEFQHSYLAPEERRSREAFYGPKMVWVVNGLRLERDKKSFSKVLRTSRVIYPAPLTFAAPSNQCAFLRNWADSRVGVIFDFGSAVESIIPFREPVLWSLVPNRSDGSARFIPVRAADFIADFRNGAPLKGMDFTKVVQRAAKIATLPAHRRQHHRSRLPIDFREHLAREERKRARRRM